MHSRMHPSTKTYYRTALSFSVLYFFTGCAGQNKTTFRGELCVGSYQTETEAIEQLTRFSQTHANLNEWKTRAKNIRENMLRGAELLPLPKRTPLRPIFRKKRTYDGYSVENVAFECFPGIFVTGSLYRPIIVTPPYPSILCPHGH